eukprot:GFYU01067870.1.p1 GENE.GFYU01067870.1~~GFYU01067870.1.p1  ORF type:complete len:126 (-),score=39.55 GFYU01067870.1:10-387(-)
MRGHWLLTRLLVVAALWLCVSTATAERASSAVSGFDVEGAEMEYTPSFEDAVKHSQASLSTTEVDVDSSSKKKKHLKRKRRAGNSKVEMGGDGSAARVVTTQKVEALKETAQQQVADGGTSGNLL